MRPAIAILLLTSLTGSIVPTAADARLCGMVCTFSRGFAEGAGRRAAEHHPQGIVVLSHEAEDSLAVQQVLELVLPPGRVEGLGVGRGHGRRLRRRRPGELHAGSLASGERR